MATWLDVQRQIEAVVQPGCLIPKCDGIGRRAVISNRLGVISIRTGVTTNQTKTISYQMLEHALATLNRAGRFTSVDFRGMFEREYAAAPCRYSVTGGILVEVGVAVLVTGNREGTCVYELA